MGRHASLRGAAFLVLGLVVGAGLLHSQQPPLPGTDQNTGERTVSRIFPIRHADPEQLSAALRTLAEEVTLHSELGVVTVRASTSDMRAVEEALRLIDVRPQPRTSIELIAHLVIADDEPEDELPADLVEAAEKLRATFLPASVSASLIRAAMKLSLYRDMRPRLTRVASRAPRSMPC